MKTIERWKALTFVGGLLIVAFVINSGWHHRIGQFQPSQIGQTSSQPPNFQPQNQAADPSEGFTAQARQVIANDVAGQDETAFTKRFALKCLSVSQSKRQIASYGVNADLVVVNSRFRVSTMPTTSSTQWAKTYKVSETIETGQFQGLTDSDTIRRVVASLKEQMTNDNEALAVLKKAPSL